MSHIPPPSTLPPGSIVDSYRRDSGGMRQDQSTDQQLIEIQAFCKQYGLILRHPFVDEAKSGKSTAGRDDFNRMMATYEVSGSRPHGLLLWNYARFARDIDDAQFNKIKLRQWGIVAHSLNDPIPEGDYGKVIEFLIDVTNEEKRKQTSIDAKRGLRDLVQRHGCVPGTPPAGFKRTPVNLGIRRDKSEHIAHRWDTDPEWTARIQKAFQMRAAHVSLNQIHKETRIFGSLNSYKTFFTNALYIGILHFGELTIENYCDPMIDRKTWDAVQRIVEMHANRQNLSRSELHPRRHAASYTLSGLVYCMKCKSPLYGMTSGQRSGDYYYRYACTRATRRRDCEFKPIPARQLEQNVIQALKFFVSNPDNLAALLEQERMENEEIIEKQKDDAKDLQKKLVAARRSIANVTDAIAENGHSKAMLKKLAELESQETELQTRLQKIKRQTPEPIPDISREEIVRYAQHLTEVLDSKDPVQIRNAFITVIDSILVDRNDNLVRGTIAYKTRSQLMSKESGGGEETFGIMNTVNVDNTSASMSPSPVGALPHDPA